jgi:hypothetical protein
MITATVALVMVMLWRASDNVSPAHQQTAADHEDQQVPEHDGGGRPTGQVVDDADTYAAVPGTR